MIYHMNLNGDPFDLIDKKIKTIELRLNDERRKDISVGDYILFTHSQIEHKKMLVEVIHLYHFDSFKELYKSLPLDKCGYTNKNIDNARSSDMDIYYSQEQQSKYGVVGIEIKHLITFETFDDHIGLNQNYDRIDRQAARAIILKDNKILVLKSDHDEVKLPGGGLENNEDFTHTLIREVKEETGYDVLSWTEFGTITEVRKKQENEHEIFVMVSKYYIALVDSKKDKLNLQGYEIDKHFRPTFIPIEEAIKINQHALNKNSDNQIAERELIVFKQIYK